MLILQSKNIIVDQDQVKIVPISDSLENIDTVRTIVRKVLKDKDYAGKILSIHNYLINDDKRHVLIGRSQIKNIVCPFRELSRKI